MKNVILFIILFVFKLGFCQDNNSPIAKEGYDLYLIYDDIKGIFIKPIDTKDATLQYVVYTLRIPNQKDPRVVFNFKDKDSLQLSYSIKGGNGNDYDFNFFYDSKKHKKFNIKENKYLKNKITI